MIKNMNTTRSTGASLIAVLSVLALSACFPGTPAPTLTPVAPPSESAAPAPDVTEAAPAPVVAANVVISATSVTVFDAGVNTLVSVPFTTDGVTAANQLTAALGETPTVAAIAGSGCRRAGSEFKWGGLTLISAGAITMAPGAVFSVVTDGATTGSGINIETTNGWHVGVPVADVIAALPGAVMDDNGAGWIRIALENSGGAGPDVTGVLAVSKDGPIINISSPVYIFGDC